MSGCVIREVSLLKELEHPHVVRYTSAIVGSKQVCNTQHPLSLAAEPLLVSG